MNTSKQEPAQFVNYKGENLCQYWTFNLNPTFFPELKRILVQQITPVGRRDKKEVGVSISLPINGSTNGNGKFLKYTPIKSKN